MELSGRGRRRHIRKIPRLNFKGTHRSAQKSGPRPRQLARTHIRASWRGAAGSFTDCRIPVPTTSGPRPTSASAVGVGMKLGTAIAEIMKREGIEILCGYPVNHLIEHAANANIRPVMVRQERIGLHMADAIS